MAQRKLRLDAAVIGAISSAASNDSTTAAETGAMGQLLAQLLTEPHQTDPSNAEVGDVPKPRSRRQAEGIVDKPGNVNHSAIEID